MQSNKLSLLQIFTLVCIAILVIYVFLVIILNDNKSAEQSKAIQEIKIQQEELFNSISKVNENVVTLNTYSASLNLIMNELKDIKEATYEVKALEFQTEMNALDNIVDKEKWFLEYMDICERYKEYVPMPITIYDIYSEDEIYLIERMVETEIGGGTFEQKVNVADVVWNRIENDRWPDTIAKIIVPGQFAFGKTQVSESTRLAVEYSFMFPDQTNGALAFHSMGQSEKFGNYYFLLFDGNHSFYGKKTEE